MLLKHKFNFQIIEDFLTEFERIRDPENYTPAPEEQTSTKEKTQRNSKRKLNSVKFFGHYRPRFGGNFKSDARANVISVRKLQFSIPLDGSS